MYSGGSDRRQVQGQPRMLITVLSEKENQAEEWQDELEIQHGEMERVRTPPRALGCHSHWSREEGTGRELTIQKYLS